MDSARSVAPLFVIASLLALATVAKAQEKSPPPATKPQVNATGKKMVVKTPAMETNKTTRKKKTSNSLTFLTVGYLQWQEGIKATRGSETSNVTFFQRGVEFSLGQILPWSGDWLYSYSGAVALGELKGQGNAPGSTITDKLRNQYWFAFTAAPGIIWKTSPVSEVALEAPLRYRKINWNLDSTAGLTLDKSNSFSIGPRGVFSLRFSSWSSFNVTGEYQILWQSVIWAFNWQYTFH